MRRWRMLLVSAMAISILICFPNLGLTADKAINARFTDQHPNKHFLAQLASRFAETVEKRSAGRLKIRVFPNAQLYKDREVIEAVRSTSVEMGNVNLGHWTSIYPSMNLIEHLHFAGIEIPFWYRLFDGQLGEIFGEKMKKVGALPLMWLPTSTADAITNNKRAIHAPNDFKGLLIRVPDNARQTRVEHLGGIPVNIPASDIYTSLQYGTIEGAWTALVSIYDRKLYEIQKFLTVFPGNPSFNSTIVSYKFFQSLPKDLQDILLQCAGETQRWGRQAVEKDETEKIQRLGERMKVNIISAQEVTAFKEKLKGEIQEFIKSAGPEGEELVKLVQKMQKEAGK